MKTIYTAVLKQLKEKAPSLKWIDMDKGQLKLVGKEDRPPLIYPCALIGIAMSTSKDITDTIQDCKATVTVKLVFDPMLSERTSAGAPDAVVEASLNPYEIIAEVYIALQGFETEHFNPLSRTSQGEETHASLFVYKQLYGTEFEDLTAEE